MGKTEKSRSVSDDRKNRGFKLRVSGLECERRQAETKDECTASRFAGVDIQLGRQTDDAGTCR